VAPPGRSDRAGALLDQFPLNVEQYGQHVVVRP
jgi:hypothetical protein